METASSTTITRPVPRMKPYALNVLTRLKENRLAVTGLVIILLLCLVAILAPVIAPHDPIEQNLKLRLLSPTWEYPFGTDDLGRCVLSRLMYGTAFSLRVGITVVSITAGFGTIIGLVAGFAGGIVDEIIMRIVDILMAFPGLVLALVIAGVLGPGLFNIMLALSIIGWTGYARLVRGCVLSVKEKTFIQAVKTIGYKNHQIIFRYILPEVISPVVVVATLGMGGTILSAAALSFLGFGAKPPTPEWGSMLNNGRIVFRVAPHLTIFPGLAIMITVLAFNFLGDGIRDALDPRQKKGVEI